MCQRRITSGWDAQQTTLSYIYYSPFTFFSSIHSGSTEKTLSQKYHSDFLSICIQFYFTSTQIMIVALKVTKRRTFRICTLYFCTQKLRNSQNHYDVFERLWSFFSHCINMSSKHSELRTYLYLDFFNKHCTMYTSEWYTILPILHLLNFFWYHSLFEIPIMLPSSYVI